MLSEVDLRDWIRLDPKPLYDVKRDSYVELREGDSNPLLLFFNHIDGMYSLCHTLAGEVVHIAAWSKVYPLKEPD